MKKILGVTLRAPHQCMHSLIYWGFTPAYYWHGGTAPSADIVCHAPKKSAVPFFLLLHHVSQVHVDGYNLAGSKCHISIRPIVYTLFYERRVNSIRENIEVIS